MAKIPYNNFMGLLNVGSSSFVKPNNELSAMKNCYEYKTGELKKVPGYTVVGDQVVDTKSVNALHHYYKSSTDTDYLVCGSDSSTNYIIRYRTTGNWLTPTGTPTYSASAGAEIDMATYLDRVFIVGHDSGTFLANATLLGVAYDTTDSNLTSMPKGKYVSEFRDLLYVGNTYVSTTKYPNRVYYCDEPSSGAITWANTATTFLQLGQDSGDEITGMVEALDRLIVFKHYSTWTWDESNKIKALDIGCDSYRSVQVIDKVPYWFNRNGLWRWAGGTEQLISKKIQPFIDAVTPANLGQQIGVQYEMEYRCFLGTVTVEGITYTNAWACFDILKEKVYIRCTFDDVKSACMYVESGKRRTYFGNDDGYVMKFYTDVDTTDDTIVNRFSDNGNEIDSFFITNNLDHGSPATINRNSQITVFSKNPQGMKMAIQTDNSGYFNKDNILILKKNVETKELNASGNRFKYKFYEKSDQKSWQFEGFVIDIKEKEVKY